MTCQGPQCDKEAVAHGLCPGHLAQRKRKGKKAALTPLQVKDGDADRVIFRCPGELKRAAATSAAGAGVDVSEWWRRAGQAALNIAEAYRNMDRDVQKIKEIINRDKAETPCPAEAMIRADVALLRCSGVRLTRGKPKTCKGSDTPCAAHGCTVGTCRCG